MLVLEHRRYLGNNSLLFQNGGISICEVGYTHKVSEDWHCHEQMHFTLFVKGGTIEKEKRPYHDTNCRRSFLFQEF